MVMEFDDFACTRTISDMCRSRDCREELDRLHVINPAFKVTLFAIPMEMTLELFNWCKINDSWVSLAWHGFYHSSNHECEKLTYEDFDLLMRITRDLLPPVKIQFDNIFRAPGWMISDGVYRWLLENDWVVCDQSYNDERRPKGLKAYVNYDNQFSVISEKVGWERWDVEAHHGHVWDVGWNGITEDWDKVSGLVKETETFQFVKELF